MQLTDFLNLDFLAVQIIIALISGAVGFLQNDVIDRIVNHEKYKIARKVFDRIDPLLELALKGEAQFYYGQIKDAIRAVSSKELSEEKIEEFAQFITKKFDLAKVLTR